MDALADLVDVLDLSPLDPAGREGEHYLFAGRSQPMPHGRVYGGQVLAQSLIAAGRSVPEDRAVHSMHGYFLRPGDSNEPIEFSVERLRDGNSFSARRTHALQHGVPILSMIASFQTPARGLDHQDPMPSEPGPHELTPMRDYLAGIDSPVARAWEQNRPIDIRHIEVPIYVIPDPELRAHQAVWMRTYGELPDDPLLHSAVLAYASDYSILESALRAHGVSWADRRLRPASLDHAMWFHRPVRADGWILYATESPSAHGGRGLGIGRMFTAEGVHAATIGQEGMIRIKESS
ncbi:MAG: acyl-CoA thioesterase [Actinomycetales bacterium]